MTFDPNRFMIRLKQRNGTYADYLPVAARLAWFRDAHPDGVIAIEQHVITEQVAIFRARVSVPNGGSAEGWGSETPQDFKDYIEKGSTKALGRALAAMGFGVLETADELDEGERIVEAPVPRPDATGAAEPDAPAVATKRDDAPLISWTQVWSIAHKRGLHSREDLARYLGVNAATLDPPEIYRRLTTEPAGVNG